MKIVHDHHYSDDGVTLVAMQSVDTADPACAKMLASCAITPTVREAAGYNVPTSIPEYKGLTRWDVIVHELTQFGTVNERAIIGV